MSLKPAEKARDDRYFTYSNCGFSKVFSDLMNKSDLKDLHFHDLRRAKISKMLSLGGSDNTLQWLVNASTKTLHITYFI